MGRSEETTVSPTLARQQRGTFIVDSTKGGLVDRKSLLAAFRIAIDKENEAFAFYADIAKNTDDSEMKKLFQHFANDEFAHSEALKEMYSSLRDKVRPEGEAG